MNLYIFNETARRGAVFGVGTYMRELTAALKDSYINVCVVNLMSDKPQILIEEIDGIKYWYLPAPVPEQQPIDYQKQRELYFRNVVYLLQLHIVDKKDLVFHLNYMECKTLADALRVTFNCKILLTVHCLNAVMALFGNISRLRRIILQTNEPTEKVEISAKDYFQKDKELFHAVDKIICLSDHTFDMLHQDYQIDKGKMIVIYNGLTDSAQASDKQVLRQKYHIPDIPIILFAGRLDEIKGLTYLLRAFKMVLNKYPHCHILIAGNGDFSMHMKECEDIWTHVTWTGLIDKAKLYDLYSIADFGVMPSFHEQCSYVAIEMMMHGLPIIGSTSTGLKEMIVDGETGLHIPVIEHPDSVEIDSSLMAEKMLYLLQRPDERKRMDANARRQYETIYSAKIFRKNMLDFYYSPYTNLCHVKNNN